MVNCAVKKMLKRNGHRLVSEDCHYPFQENLNILCDYVARKTSTELEFTDITPFCFRVPFHVKNEANMLKVEVSGAKSRKSMGADRETTAGYKRRRGKKGKYSSDDDDDLIDDEPDEDVPDENDDGATAEELLAGEEVAATMNGDLEGGAQSVTPPDGEGTPKNAQGSGTLTVDGASQSGL
jgi:hypothetical protein